MDALVRPFSTRNRSDEGVQVTFSNRLLTALGNAPRVEWREMLCYRTTRGALPTRLNEAVVTARGLHPARVGLASG